ncbi:pre-rRNA processing protein, partial [Tulasnella sp. 427]
MPDPLFKKVSGLKRKRVSQPTVSNPKPRKVSRKNANNTPLGSRKRRNSDEDIDERDEAVGAFDNVDLEGPLPDANDSGDEYDDETPAQKRLRLAKLYLNNVKKSVARGGREGHSDDDADEGEVVGWDAEDLDREILEARLQKDVLEHSGKVHVYVADSVGSNVANAPSTRLRGHKMPVTAAVMSEDGRMLFSASKDGSIVKWDLITGKRVYTLFKKRRPPPNAGGKGKGKAPEAVEGHTDEVLALALSSDGKYLVSGGKDRKVVVWDAQQFRWLKSFGGHKDLISALVIRKGTHQLFSASYDRTVKIFDLSPQVMGYIETLFGHQDVITSVDSMRSETALTSGARDKSVRFWKVVEENQLVFRGGGRSALRDVLEGIPVDDEEAEKRRETEKAKKGTNDYHEGSIDCVAFIDEATFLSGGDSGAIRLWANNKKKAVYTRGLAHGLHEVHSETEGIVTSPRWITALAVLRYSNVFASGSWEGTIRLWKLDDKNRSFSPLSVIPAPGVINSLQMISPPTGALDAARWVSQPAQSSSDSDDHEMDSDDSSSASSLDGQPKTVVKPKSQRLCVIVAALGQEPRPPSHHNDHGGNSSFLERMESGALQEVQSLTKRIVQLCSDVNGISKSGISRDDSTSDPSAWKRAIYALQEASNPQKQKTNVLRSRASIVSSFQLALDAYHTRYNLSKPIPALADYTTSDKDLSLSTDLSFKVQKALDTLEIEKLNLLGDRAMLRQIQNRWLAPHPISRLPPELLSLIFILSDDPKPDFEDGIAPDLYTPPIYAIGQLPPQ